MPPFYKIGGFLLPRNIFPQIFSENFSNLAKATFFCIFGAKNYGGKRHLVLPKWGGVPFRMLSTQQGSLHFIQQFRVPLLLQSWQIFGQSGQKVAKMNFFLLAFVFSRENRRPKGAKFKIYLNLRIAGAFVLALSLWRWWCPLVAGDQALWGFRTCQRLRWSSGRVFRCFCPLSRFALGALPTNMALFRVLRAFLGGCPCWMWVCIASMLCVACGAFVRVNS